MSTVEILSAAAFLSFAVNRLVELFVRPIREQKPNLNMWWLFYVGLVLGGVASYYSGLNAFVELAAIPPLLGQIITALAVGGGPGVLADFLNRESNRKEKQ